MVKQARVERRQMLRRLWIEIGKKFTVIYAISLLIIVLIPFTRSNGFMYLMAFLLSFGVAIFIMFYKAKEKPPELTHWDR